MILCKLLYRVLNPILGQFLDSIAQAYSLFSGKPFCVSFEKYQLFEELNKNKDVQQVYVECLNLREKITKEWRQILEHQGLPTPPKAKRNTWNGLRVFRRTSPYWHLDLRWGGRWEWGSGWGTHVRPWQIHADVWQNQYNIIK